MTYKIIQLNSARNCLRFLIKTFEIKEIYLPYYLCSCVRHAVHEEGCRIKFYHIDKDFFPTEKFPPKAYILYPNYWGICDENVQKFVQIYPNLIVDNAHAFWAEPVGLAGFNSMRKFFPQLRDGAILYTSKSSEISFSQDDFEYLPQKLTYEEICKNESRINSLEIKTISNTTKKLFQQINLEKEKQNRLENFHALHKSLKDKNLLTINLSEKSIPFCYPFLAPSKGSADELVEEFAQKNITIYRYWENLPESFLENSFREKLVAIPLI